MNIKALIKSLLLRKFTTGLLLLQLALTLALLVNSGILTLDTHAKLTQQTGIDKENTILIDFVPTSPDYADRDFYLSVINRDIATIKEIPGVIDVAPSNQRPMQFGGFNSNMHDVNNPEQEQLNNGLRYVAEFYSNGSLTNVFNLKLVEGRRLTELDNVANSNEAPIVVTHSLAKALYGEESALGKVTNRGHIVGVVEDFKIRANQPLDNQYGFFKSQIFTGANWMNHYFIRVEPGMLESVQGQLKDTLISLQADRDIREVASLNKYLEIFFGDDIGLAKLFALLCALMVLVTAISSFAHAQFHITKQRRLIGIRRALGARKRDILIYVLGENWILTVFGLIVGVFAVIAVNMLLSSVITLNKPSLWLYLVATAVIFISGTLATLLPAWQTSRIPPVIATRSI